MTILCLPPFFVWFSGLLGRKTKRKKGDLSLLGLKPRTAAPEALIWAIL